MKTINLLLATSLSLATFTAQATLFDFSYVFIGSWNGNVAGVNVTGSLTGDLVGNYVQNVGNMQVAFNGTPLSGPLFAASYNEFTGWSAINNTSVSTVADLNNFIFANSDIGNGILGYTDYFLLVHGTGWSEASGSNPGAGLTGTDFPTLGSWSLVAHNIPEPDILTLFGVGMIGLGVAQYRRNELHG